MDVKNKETFYARTSWSDIDQSFLVTCIHQALLEDMEGACFCGDKKHVGDITTQVIGLNGVQGDAQLVAKQDCIVVGTQLIPLILNLYGEKVDYQEAIIDGTVAQRGAHIGTLSGSIEAILSAERVILNFIQHLSGIANNTAAFLTALGSTSTKLLDTRKTTPGFRALEKYAVSCGGGWNHRRGLYDRVMFKDNHLAASRMSLKELVQQSRHLYPEALVEIEVDNLEQLEAALIAQPDAVLLDNFSIEILKEAVSMINGQCLSEASGGITMDSIAQVGQVGVDFISCGALTHQSQWVDIGLDWN